MLIQIRDNSQFTSTVYHGEAEMQAVYPILKFISQALSSSNTSIFFNEDELVKLPVATNWTINGTPPRGIGNTTTNINWILSLRARPEGSGTVTMTPTIVGGDSIINLIFKYNRDTQYSVNTLKIIFPSGFTWSQNIAQVSITNFTASSSVSADTILFTNINFVNDSVTISIANVTSPTFTGNYKFKFLSGRNLTC